MYILHSIIETLRKVRAIFGRNNAPPQIIITRLLATFKETGSVINKKATTKGTLERQQT